MLQHLKGKNSSLFLFLCIFATQFVFGQEQLVPLKSNHLPSENVQYNLAKSNVAYPSNIYYLLDTLNLPIVDDFSSNKFQDYYYFSYPISLVTEKKLYSYELSNIVPAASLSAHPAKLNYSKLPQKDIIYNVITSQYDTIATPQFTISFFSFPKTYPQSPFDADSSFTAWRAARRYDLGATDTVIAVDLSIVSDSLYIDTIKCVQVTGSPFEKRIWMDEKKTIFTNNTFCKNQYTIGVATFDGLNEKGMPYDTSPVISNGRADYLTSKPIRMINSSPKYLSFLWQRQGLGDEPEFTDSLILQFRTPTMPWTTMWYQSGGQGDTVFTQKTIVVDSVFLVTGFQFRFINRATLNGSNDHWNVDYIRLVATAADTIIDDLAFVSHPTSFLADYESVPYTQYSPALMASIAQNKINNLSEFLTGQNSNFNFRVTDYFGANQLDAFNIDNFNFANGINQCSFCDLVINPLKVTPSHLQLEYPPLSQCSEFKVKQWLTPLNLNTMRENDTTQFIQTLSDYYAYDDGSAEAGYLLSNAGSNMAIQFEVYNADDMRGMRIFFDPVNANYSSVPFYLRVWKDSVNSTGFHFPGTILKEYGPMYPDYDDANGISKYAEYLFDVNVTLQPGVYYAGFYKEDANGLNVGFDRNRNLQTKMYFTPQTSTWANTQFEGSYMIRPVFGTCPNGVPSFISNSENDVTFSMFPNPALDFLHFNIYNPEHVQLSLVELSGSEVFTTELRSSSLELDLSRYASGIYLVRLYNYQTGAQSIQKLVIQK